MVGNIGTFSFTIHPRSIPDAIPPVPESVPLLGDYKKTGGTQHDWNMLRACYDERYKEYRQVVILHQKERAIVNRLSRIKSQLF
jgi:hypothetical protein